MEEAFYGLPGRITRAIEPHTESHPAALLLQLLICAGNAIGRSAHFIVEGDRHALNEYGVAVGETSKARKGTAWGRIKHIFSACDPEWVKDRIVSGLSSGEGLITAVCGTLPAKTRVSWISDSLCWRPSSRALSK